jgi:hypothetical protein
MSRPFGHDFMIELSDSISAATETALASDPHAFDFRSRPLWRAVERELFTGLVNSHELQEAFVGKREGREPSPPAGRDALERAVLERLLGVSAPRATVLRRLGGRARAVARSRTARQAIGPTGAARPVCFVLDHAKFLDFLAPALALLDPDEVAFVSLDPALTERLRAAGLTHVALDPSRTPRARGEVGAALRSRPHLPALCGEIERAARALGARCIVVGEGNSPYDELANQAAKLLGVPCACFQQGWSPVPHTGFRRMAYDAMAVWGAGFADLLAPRNPEQRFVQTGNLAFDRRPPVSRPLSAITRSRRSVGFFTGTTSPLMSERDMKDFLAVIEAVAARVPAAAVLVREHPAHGLPASVLERLGALSNVTIASPRDYPLREVIEASDVIVSDYSTTLIEGAALLRPAVACNFTSMPRYLPDLEQHGVGLEFKEAPPGIDAIERLLEDDAYYSAFAPRMEQFRDRFFCGADGRAAERLVALIRELSG